MIWLGIGNILHDRFGGVLPRYGEKTAPMKRQVTKLLLGQYLLATIFTAVAAWWGGTAAFSALTGCLAALIPNTFFCIKMLRASSREYEEASQFVRDAFRAEFQKWLMTGMILLLAFTSDYPWNPGFLFAGFGILLFTGVFVSFVLKGDRE